MCCICVSNLLRFEENSVCRLSDEEREDDDEEVEEREEEALEEDEDQT